MNDEERKACEALLVSMFNGRVLARSAQLWVATMRHHEKEDVVQGARAHSEREKHPSLAGLVEAVRAAKKAREARGPPALRLQLPERIDPGPEAERRSHIARQIAVDMVEGRIPRTVNFQAEITRRMKDGE